MIKQQAEKSNKWDATNTTVKFLNVAVKRLDFIYVSNRYNKSNTI